MRKKVGCAARQKRFRHIHRRPRGRGSIYKRQRHPGAEHGQKGCHGGKGRMLAHAHQVVHRPTDGGGGENGRNVMDGHRYLRRQKIPNRASQHGAPHGMVRHGGHRCHAKGGIFSKHHTARAQQPYNKEHRLPCNGPHPRQKGRQPVFQVHTPVGDWRGLSLRDLRCYFFLCHSHRSPSMISCLSTF